MLRISNVVAIVGLVLLTFAMASVVFLITNRLYGLGPAVPVALVVLALLGSAWFAVPLYRKVEDTR
jgi:hypothetical protein